MKAPLAALALFAAVSFLAPPVRAQDHAVLADPLPEMLVKMQGKWAGLEKGGQAKCWVTFTGSAMHFQDGNKGPHKKEWYKAVAIVPAAVTPAQLSAKITESSDPGLVGKTVPALVKVENGALTLVACAPGAAEAPKGFEGDADSRTFVFHKAE